MATSFAGRASTRFRMQLQASRVRTGGQQARAGKVRVLSRPVRRAGEQIETGEMSECAGKHNLQAVFDQKSQRGAQRLPPVPQVHLRFQLLPRKKQLVGCLRAAAEEFARRFGGSGRVFEES